MKVNFFTAQLLLWKRIFDYKGTSDRKEYWFAFIFHVIIGVLVNINITISFLLTFVNTKNGFSYQTADVAKVFHYLFLILGVILLGYLVLSIIPWIALTVRRLRDAGKSAWLVLLLLVFGIGHVVLFVLCAAGSLTIGLFNPRLNSPAGIYGPPPDDILYPQNNMNDPVYGPPPFELEEDENDYDPSENMEPDVYGPPEMFDGGFEPDKNMQPVIYGPPEMFDKDDDSNNEDSE